MQPRTRSEMAELIDAIQELGWDVREYDASEGQLVRDADKLNDDPKPAGAEMSMEISKSFLEEN